MPGSGKYTTFDPLPITDPAVGKGKSDVNALRTIFATSPLKNDGTNRTNANALGQAFLTPKSVDDGGYMFGTVNIDFSDAPDYKDVATGGGGLPSTAFTPNINSPGDGNGANPTAVNPMDPAAVPQPNLSYDPAGDGTENPTLTSKQISSITLGDALKPGKRPGT